MSVTISGSPSTRRHLLETSPAFQNLQQKEIPIRGPYHAAHLYGEGDVTRIIDSDMARSLEQHSVIHPVTGWSLPKVSNSTLDVFRQCVLEILAHQVQWDRLVKSCVAEVRSSAVKGVRVLAMGPTALTNSLVSAFKVGGGLTIALEDGVSWFNQNPLPRVNGDQRNAKIAIVGMAGRFPNAADHEAFWKLLEQGLDVHREVSFSNLSR